MLYRRHFLRAATAAALGAPGLAGLAQQAVTLKFHTLMTSNSDAWTRMFVPWMDKVTADSRGRIRFEAYPAMQLGGTAAQLYDQVKDGVVDVVWTLSGLTAGRFPRSEVFELPFIMNNPDATSRAFWEYVQTQAPDEYKDVQPIALHVTSAGVFHSRRKAIHTPADLRGMKVRGPTRQVTKLLAALGAIPVGMPLPQVAEAMSKGTVDAAMLPWQTISSAKLDELARFHSEFPATVGAPYTTTCILAANKARYESLAPDLRRVIDNNSGSATSGWLARTAASTDPQGRKLATDHGNVINVITPAEAAEFVAVARPLNEEWIAEMNRLGYDGRKLFDAARALIAKHGRIA
jgi:TRAP-type C4-dicarboxylate transport system substrate-binding protein